MSPNPAASLNSHFSASSSLPRSSSSQKSPPPIDENESEAEPEVPWVAALTTYFGYALLFLFGYIREGARNWLPISWLPRSFAAKGPDGYAPLADDYDDFYTRRLYHRIQDCWGRPISYVRFDTCTRFNSLFLQFSRRRVDRRDGPS
jgi:hypothetical protein